MDEMTTREGVMFLKGKVKAGSALLGDLNQDGIFACVRISNGLLEQIKEEVEKEFVILPLSEVDSLLYSKN